MKKNSYFINTSRGEIINENDLCFVLRKNLIKGAALDVFENEQDINVFKNKKLLKDKSIQNKLVVTSHIGGCTVDSMRKTEEIMANKLYKLYKKD